MSNLQQLPRLNRIEFFRDREDELAVSLTRAIAEHIDRFPDVELTDRQRAILAWAAAAINVPNGGFVQYFFNQRDDLGITELAALFDNLDLFKAAAILRDAAAVYRQHRDKFKVDNPWDGLFGDIKELRRT